MPIGPAAPELIDPTRVAFLPAGQRRVWRAVQAVVWLLGLVLLVGLLGDSKVALHALWDVVVPIAPLLVVLAPGLWRNVCPLATTALLPSKGGVSGTWRPSRNVQGWMALAGVVLLYAIVPLRHVTMNTSGPATAAVLVGLLAVALAMAMLFDAKSGWCSGVCPVHPVERLYGSEPMLRVANAHCHECVRCVAPCPDSVPGIDPLSRQGRDPRRQLAGSLLLGGFPGFVCAWFFVPDFHGAAGWDRLDLAYGLPLLGAVVSWVVYRASRQLIPSTWRLGHTRAFAAAAVVAYYWFRLPALGGWGPHPGDGMLVDLSQTLPAWTPYLSRFVTTAALLWLLVWRRSGGRSWAVRPPFAS